MWQGDTATRVGIVGCGVIAKVYADKLNALPFIDLVACADLDSERATEFATEHDIPRALSVDAVLGDPDVDVVVNLTIPQAHVGVSRAALDAGKSVFSEKPLGANGQGRARVWLRRRVPKACASAARPTRSSAPGCRPAAV